MSADIALLGHKVKLSTCPPWPNPGSASVWLSSCVPLQAHETFLDAGCGGGAVGLCLLNRAESASGTFLDLSPELIATAQQNSLNNGVGSQARTLVGNILTYQPDTPFTHTFANPPFYDRSTSPKSAVVEVERAHGADENTLTNWFSALLNLTQENGTCSLLLHTTQLQYLPTDFTHTTQLIHLRTHKAKSAKQFVLHVVKNSQPNFKEMALNCWQEDINKAALTDGLCMLNMLESIKQH